MERDKKVDPVASISYHYLHFVGVADPDPQVFASFSRIWICNTAVEWTKIRAKTMEY
jgi:hypothetical protein